MRPYIPNTKVGDYKLELPHYYCNKHNPGPNEYPTEPGKPVTIVTKPVLPPVTPEKPGGNDNGNNDNGNGETGNQNPDDNDVSGQNSDDPNISQQNLDDDDNSQTPDLPENN